MDRPIDIIVAGHFDLDIIPEFLKRAENVSEVMVPGKIVQIKTDGEPAAVSITVEPVNDAPVAADDSYTVLEDNQLTVQAAGVLENDTDVDGDPLTVLVFLRDRLDVKSLDRELHVVQDEVDLDPAGESPVRQLAIDLPVAHEGGQLVKNPVFEGLAVKLRTGEELAASSQSVHHADVDEVELGRTDDAALGSSPEGG